MKRKLMTDNSIVRKKWVKHSAACKPIKTEMAPTRHESEPVSCLLSPRSYLQLPVIAIIPNLFQATVFYIR